MRAVTPAHGVVAAPWYQLPARSLPLAAGESGGARRASRPLRLLAGAAGLALLVMCRDPADEAVTQAAGTDVAEQAARFAAIDTTLGVAVAEAQLAALRANDVALRAFAVQQAARYDELRRELRVLGSRFDSVPPQPMAAVAVARHTDQLHALQRARGPQFDRAYVRHALALNRDLLADLDATLGTIEDVELRDALEQVRGTLKAAIPGDAAGTSMTGRERGAND